MKKRYYTHLGRFLDGTLLIEASEDGGYCCQRGQKNFCSHLKIEQCETHVKRGAWKRITRAQARDILKCQP